MSCVDFLLPIKLGQGELRVLASSDARTFPVSFILKTFKLAKVNDFVEVNVAGLTDELLQFVRGHQRTLSMVLYFDGRGTNTDVRQPMKQIMDLMNVDRSTHAPPLLSFDWIGFSLQCVLERSRLESFSALFPDGRPSRGRMHVTFRESLTVEQLLREAGGQ